MKIKILAVICSLIFTAIATTSCLKSDDTDVEYSSNASITAFSINDIETKYTAKTSDNKDTTITVTLTGSDYVFSIDQNKRLIQNVDSLPVGTDIKSVVVNITADTNYIIIVNQEDSNKDSLWTSTDSLNYEKPILMKVIAADGTYGPIYTTKINVHKQVPDSLVWSSMNSNITKVEGKQKSIYFKDNILVAFVSEGKAHITSTSINDGKVWSDPYDISVDNVDVSSLMVWGDSVYILAANTLYKSSDAKEWEKVSSAPQLKNLVASYYSSDAAALSAINSDNKFVITNDGVSWTVKEDVDARFPRENLSYTAFATKHNSSIYKMLVMGNNPALSEDSTTTIWGLLNTENEWTEYSYNRNGRYCPNLDNITMINYNSKLYAFGGKSNNGIKEYKPFSKFFVSENEGANWLPVNSMVMFPEKFESLYNDAEGNYSCTVDKDNYIWIIWSNSTEIWKGRINKLGFK
jgi:hypothetical protein